MAARLSLLLLAALMACVARAATAAKISQMYVFGDESADVGNANYFNRAPVKANKLPYGVNFKPASGRFSDGKLVVDYLADFLAIGSPRADLAPRNASLPFTGLDYAMVGAGAKSGTNGGKTRGLQQQFNDFKKWFNEAKRTNNPDLVSFPVTPYSRPSHSTSSKVNEALFVVSIGANDYIPELSRAQPNMTTLVAIASSVSNLVISITQSLYNLTGSSNIVIIDQPNLGCIPAVRRAAGSGISCTDAGNQVTIIHNYALLTKTDKLRNNPALPMPNLVLFKQSAVFKTMIQVPTSGKPPTLPLLPPHSLFPHFLLPISLPPVLLPPRFPITRTKPPTHKLFYLSLSHYDIALNTQLIPIPPSPSGLTNQTHPCCEAVTSTGVVVACAESSGSGKAAVTGAACAAPSKAVWWDARNPTQAVNQKVANTLFFSTNPAMPGRRAARAADDAQHTLLSAPASPPFRPCSPSFPPLLPLLSAPASPPFRPCSPSFPPLLPLLSAPASPPFRPCLPSFPPLLPLLSAPASPPFRPCFPSFPPLLPLLSAPASPPFRPCFPSFPALLPLLSSPASPPFPPLLPLISPSHFLHCPPLLALFLSTPLRSSLPSPPSSNLLHSLSSLVQSTPFPFLPPPFSSSLSPPSSNLLPSLSHLPCPPKSFSPFFSSSPSSDLLLLFPLLYSCPPPR
ncbi:unnamed protein product [Closterium sp. Naga37s-1]|nr:unnamed protein product [Closterium sp. Naga37s-1]